MITILGQRYLAFEHVLHWFSVFKPLADKYICFNNEILYKNNILFIFFQKILHLTTFMGKDMRKFAKF